jgi:hypothetical protein
MKNQLHLVKVIGGRKVFHEILGEGEIVSYLTARPVGNRAYYEGVVKFLGKELSMNICFEPIANEVLAAHGKEFVNYSIMTAPRVVVVENKSSNMSPGSETWIKLKDAIINAMSHQKALSC